MDGAAVKARMRSPLSAVAVNTSSKNIYDNGFNHTNFGSHSARTFLNSKYGSPEGSQYFTCGYTTAPPAQSRSGRRPCALNDATSPSAQLQKQSVRSSSRDRSVGNASRQSNGEGPKQVPLYLERPTTYSIDPFGESLHRPILIPNWSMCRPRFSHHHC